MTRRSPWARPIDYDAAIAEDEREIAVCDAMLEHGWVRTSDLPLNCTVWDLFLIRPEAACVGLSREDVALVAANGDYYGSPPAIAGEAPALTRDTHRRAMELEKRLENLPGGINAFEQWVLPAAWVRKDRRRAVAARARHRRNRVVHGGR